MGRFESTIGKIVLEAFRGKIVSDEEVSFALKWREVKSTVINLEILASILKQELSIVNEQIDETEDAYFTFVAQALSTMTPPQIGLLLTTYLSENPISSESDQPPSNT